MTSTCIFQFDRPEPIYNSGEDITGSVVLTTESRKVVNDIYIRLNGTGTVQWSDMLCRYSDVRAEQVKILFRGSETYVNTRINVYSKENLPAGTHTFTFSIPLPLECPSSCMERFVKIVYEISLVLERIQDIEFNTELTVRNSYNLNLFPELLIPLKQQVVNYYCYCLCSSGPVISTFIIPFGGYTPGQSVDYALEVDNQSFGNDLATIKVTLKQTYKFTANDPWVEINKYSNVLTRVSQVNEISRLSHALIKGTLFIPIGLPPSLNCEIIQIYYTLHVDITTSTFHKDLEMEFPIIIGTTPLEQSD